VSPYIELCTNRIHRDNTDKMKSQIAFEFPTREAIPERLPARPPEGYKGLAGFHKYWGKKPTEAWHLLIERLTKPEDIVLDPFLGSGLVAKECTDLNRRFIGFDINPICLELTDLYLSPPTHQELKSALNSIYKNLLPTINDLYKLSTGDVATHLLWENSTIVKVWKKSGRARVELVVERDELQKFENAHNYTPHNKSNFRFFENSRINSKSNMEIDQLFTPRALEVIDRILDEITKTTGNTRRALRLILSAALGQMSRMVFAVSKRGKARGIESESIEVGSWVIGYWRPGQHFEVNALNCFENKANKLLKALNDLGPACNVNIATGALDFFQNGKDCFLALGDSEKLLKQIPSGSVNVILTDPPHGDRIPYLELSEMWNGFLGYESDLSGELVISNAKTRNKDQETYNQKLLRILFECSRVLRNNGVIAIMFNARSADHWESLHQLEAETSFSFVGCYPMQYSAGSVVQDNRDGGLKSDYVLLYTKSLNAKNIQTISDQFKDLPEWSRVLPARVSE